MSDHAERLNTWHLDLAIVADAIEHVLTSATARRVRRSVASAKGVPHEQEH